MNEHGSLFRLFSYARIVAASLGILALSACAQSTPELGNAGGTLSVAEKLPEPALNGDDGLPAAFRLGADDVISVNVYGNKDASVERAKIDKSGRVSVPVVGVVQAGGLGLEEFERLVERRLRENYFRNPQVAVNLLEIESAGVTVDGEVTRPGLYPAKSNMTLMQAIAFAQGVTDEARLKEVVVFRTVDGQKYAALYDLRAIRKGNYADPRLFADDLVLVGDSAARRLFRDFIQIIPLLTTPIIVAFQNN